MREIFTTNVPDSSSLGYVLYKDGTPVGSRVTTGITPVGASTGVYRALIDASICDLVIWDSGGSAPVYAAEQIAAGLEVVTPTIGASNVAVTIGVGAVTVITPTIGV